MNPQERDTIFIINKFDDFTTFTRGTKKVVLRYNIPVEIDFTDDPNFISNLLQNPQLQICTKKELEAYRLRKEGIKKTIWTPPVTPAPVAPKVEAPVVAKPVVPVVPVVEKPVVPAPVVPKVEPVKEVPKA